MLDLIIPGKELWDDERQEFLTMTPSKLQLEHSLVSLSKWESKWGKPFLGKEAKSREQTLDYIRCMTITQNIKPEVYDNLPSDMIVTIKEYIDAPMTATWFTDAQGPAKPHKSEVITAEIIYYWMITQSIPMECQKWHLNRLLTLIRVCSIKNNPPKKMSRKEMIANRRALNEKRLSQLNTKG